MTYILIAVTALIIGLAVVVARRPSDFRVSRTATIAAPAQEVFPHVNDFHKWADWSPYEKLDPAMKRSYDGPAEGTGATYAWSGNSKAGEGRSTIVESRPNELIRIKLEFLRPFACTSAAEFDFKPEGDRTAVTWSLIGKNNFMAKAFGLIMNMDKMVGGQFEQGLSQLKAVAESGNRA